jgi:hypothetical protein
LGLEEDNQGESVMEMHSRRSLYEIHGISAPLRRQLRQSPIARLTIAQILITLRRTINAIEATLAARHAITELASPSQLYSTNAVSRGLADVDLFAMSTGPRRPA